MPVPTSYRDQDYAFGQTILTLRSNIGLTQSGLAEYLGISRRSVADWEAGGKYPKAKHLQALIELAVRQSAFSSGQEADEIRALWKAARQKVLLDEVWLAQLLGADTVKQSPAPVPPSLAGTRIDWDNALSVQSFYGRDDEIEVLTTWVIDDRCQIVSVLGIGGIGKSALAVNLMRQIAPHFEVVIWRSLRDLPTCEVLLDELLRVLAPETAAGQETSIEHRLNILMELLHHSRVLLVLDNMESVMEEGEYSGQIRAGYEGFERFLDRCAKSHHQSCVLLTSREKSNVLAPLEGDQGSIRSLRLTRLDFPSCLRLLDEKGVAGTAAERARLIEMYAGNPLALKIVAQTIVDLFDGDLTLFLAQGETIFGGVRDLLKTQLSRLSALEQQILLWLAILREPSSITDLLAVLVTPAPRARLMEAMEALYRRSLIERGQRPGSFTLQSVVLEYLTSRLIDEVSSEIETGQIDWLAQYGLELASSREYVRQTQERLILKPILALLNTAYFEPANVEAGLIERLYEQRAAAHKAQGYAPANLIALLRSFRGHLRDLDMSRLAIRGVYLQGIEMQDATLADAMVHESVFTQTIDAVRSVAVSHTGDSWAAGSRRGEIEVWDAGGVTLRRTWRGHADMVCALTFSPDERLLATGSWDGTVKVWDVESGTLRWLGRHTSRVECLAFSSDGVMLASGGIDTRARLWLVESGEAIDVLEHPLPVVTLIWSLDGRMLVTGESEGYIRLWQVNRVHPAVCINTIEGTGWVSELAFSPNGSILVNSNWDGTVKLWDFPDLRLRQTLTGHAHRVHFVAWSPDGRIIASSSRDETIRLWDVEQNSLRAVLRGHSAGVVGLAFTPDSRSMLSGSEDGTLRVWDVESGRCTRVMYGYVASLYDVDWSPDSTHLVSGGTDNLVTVYPLDRATPPFVLPGHTQVICGVSWSPDRRWIASSDWDNTVRLWEPTTGECIDIIRHPEDALNGFFDVEWSPDGQQLACGTWTHGVQIVNIDARHLHFWTRERFPTLIRPVAWSPDGQYVAGGGDDGCVYVWDSAQEEVIAKFGEHTSMVTSLAWSADGTRLVSSSYSAAGGELFVWDVRQGKRLQTITDHPGMVYAVNWCASDDEVVSGDSDGILRWWNVKTGARIHEQEAHHGTVRVLRRSPDGSMLASCGNDGAIKLWDNHSGKYLRTVRRDRPYERMDITGIRGLTEAQKQSLRTLGAVEHA